MKRTLKFLSGVLGVAGALALTTAAQAQPPAPGAAPAAAPPATRPTIAVFNMAGVMRDFGLAKYRVHVLNTRKAELSKQLLAWRGEYVQLQQDVQRGGANMPAGEKEKAVQRMLWLSRAIEDEDRKISKQLNDDASSIIGDLYDKIKMVVDKTAEMNGYHIVFAYPDAVTAEELNSPFIKELKLKPPAAQPFYVAPHADITSVVVKTLNVWFKPLDAAGKEVDVNSLPKMDPTPGTTGAPSTTGAPAAHPTGAPSTQPPAGAPPK